MLSILLILVHSGNFVLNGVTASLIFFWVLSALLQFIAWVCDVFFWDRFRYSDGLLKDIANDFQGKWKNRRALLFIGMAISIILQAFFYLRFLA